MDAGDVECPGLNGLWRACPPTISGLTPDERGLFRALGEPVFVLLLIAAIVIATLLAVVAIGGLWLGPYVRRRFPPRIRRVGRPRALRLAAARRHVATIRRERRWATSAVHHGTHLRV